MPSDNFVGHNKGLISPAYGGSPVSPNDSSDLPQAGRSLWVGGAGNISMTFIDGSSAILYGVVAGTLIPVRALRVHSTGTTATSMTNLY